MQHFGPSQSISRPSYILEGVLDCTIYNGLNWYLCKWKAYNVIQASLAQDSELSHLKTFSDYITDPSKHQLQVNYGVIDSSVTYDEFEIYSLL